MAARAAEDATTSSSTAARCGSTTANEAGRLRLRQRQAEAGYRGITASWWSAACRLHRRQKEDKLGIRASSTCEIILEDCRVPRSRSSARPARATKSPSKRSTRPHRHRRADDRPREGRPGHAVRYTKERKQFGKPSRSSSCAGPARAHGTEIEAARLLVYNAPGCAMPASRSSPRRPWPSSTRRRWRSASRRSHQSLRRLRLREGLPRREALRDAKIGQIYEGTSNMQLVTIAKRCSVRG